MQERYH